METNEQIQIETLNSLTEAYSPNKKSHENQKSIHSNVSKKHSHKKIDSPKKRKTKFSPDIKKMKNINSNNKNNSSPKRKNHHNRHRTSIFTSNIHEEKNEIYDREKTKSQDKKIKINLVSQKFKIADDFNEKNSNQFLKEKDECLKAIILSDKIEEEKAIPFYVESGKGSIYEISSIKQNEDEDSLNKRKIKRKKYKNDSTNLLFELVYSLK